MKIVQQISEQIQKIKDENMIYHGFSEEGEWFIDNYEVETAWENYLQNDIEINVEFEIFVSGDPMFSRIRIFQTESEFLDFLKEFRCI